MLVKTKNTLALIGLIIGYVMTAMFLVGYRITFETGSSFGGFFVGMALALWPLYIVVVFGLTVLYKDKYCSTIKALWRGQFLVPLGAVLAIITVPWLYGLFD